MAFFEHMLLHSPNYLSLLPPWPWHTVESSSGVCQPQPQPRPVFSAASTSCLQEGQAATPSFHFLWCSLSLGVLEWTGPPQAWRLGNNPPRSLGNWSHPLPLVSAWSAVDYSQRAAAALSSLDQLSAAWCQGTTVDTKLGLKSRMTPGRFEANCSNNMFLFLMSLQRTLEIISCSTIVP